MELVISDRHEGLRQAIDAVLPGAAWRRSSAHTSNSPTPSRSWAQHARVVDQLEGRLPDAAGMLVIADNTDKSAKEEITRDLPPPCRTQPNVDAVAVKHHVIWA